MNCHHRKGTPKVCMLYFGMGSTLSHGSDVASHHPNARMHGSLRRTRTNGFGWMNLYDRGVFKFSKWRHFWKVRVLLFVCINPVSNSPLATVPCILTRGYSKICRQPMDEGKFLRNDLIRTRPPFSPVFIKNCLIFRFVARLVYGIFNSFRAHFWNFS